MLRAKLRAKWGQHGSWMPWEEQLEQNRNTFKNTIGSFKNEASRLATWQQEGCEKAKKQSQDATIFVNRFCDGVWSGWGRFWRPTWGRKWSRNRCKIVLEDGCSWKTLSRRNLGRVPLSGSPISSGRAPGPSPIIKTGTKYQD